LRIDKYLKISRIIKRRTIANEACDAGRVKVNSNTVKASYEVKVDDIIEISFGTSQFKCKVTAVNEYAKKEDAAEMYETIN